MTPTQPRLRRALGLWPTIAIVIGTVIGSGIFLVPSDMVKAVGSPALVFAVWIFGGILTLFGALTYAELSAALPEAGGEYVYLNAAYGPLFGFIYGWTQTWVAKTASIATLGTGFYTYLADFFPVLQRVLYTIHLPIGPHGGPLEIRFGQIFAIAIVLFLAGVNYLGVRVGGGVQVAVTALKMMLIGGVIVAGLTSGQGAIANFHSAMPADPGGIPGFFVALIVAALWAYDGWNNAGMLGSEIEQPQKNLPRALIGGTLSVMAIYLLANLAYFYILSGPEVGASPRVAADVMRRVMGQPGGAMVSIAAMISIFAALNGSILSGSRVPYAMARDGYFFESISRVNPRFRTPGASILLLGVWSSLLLLSGPVPTTLHFGDLSQLDSIRNGSRCGDRFALQTTRSGATVPGARISCRTRTICFCSSRALSLLFHSARASPRESGMGLAVILVGFPFYFHWSGRRIH